MPGRHTNVTRNLAQPLSCSVDWSGRCLVGSWRSTASDITAGPIIGRCHIHLEGDYGLHTYTPVRGAAVHCGLLIHGDPARFASHYYHFRFANGSITASASAFAFARLGPSNRTCDTPSDRVEVNLDFRFSSHRATRSVISFACRKAVRRRDGVSGRTTLHAQSHSKNRALALPTA